MNRNVMHIVFLNLLVLLLTLSPACQQTTSEDVVLLPENLTAEVEKRERGLVVVRFTAINTNFFRVGFGDANQTPELATGGTASYTYRSPGTYTITVQAHTTEMDFISLTEQVSITERDLGMGIPTTGFESPMSYEGYNLVWNDEFEGNAISSDWVHETGDGCPGLCGWGNNELQFYRPQNTEVKDGLLIITARQENFGGKSYTSSRLKTQGRKSFQYGRIDIRAALPKGQGIWPALWMLGDNIGSIGWPACGEIDIMEMVGGSASGRDNAVHGTIHWDNNGSHAYRGGEVRLSQGIFNDNFHVFSIIWDASKITWLLDDKVYHEEDIRPASMDEFRAPFFFLINLAIGGNWPGSPDASTIFPQQFAVDYIRVFEKLP